MARFYLDTPALEAIAARIAPVAGWEPMKNIDGEDGGYPEADDIVPTDTSLADWTAAQGAPRVEGDVFVFEKVETAGGVNRRGTPIERRTTVYVVEISGGTAAYVEK